MGEIICQVGDLGKVADLNQVGKPLLNKAAGQVGQGLNGPLSQRLNWHRGAQSGKSPGCLTALDNPNL